MNEQPAKNLINLLVLGRQKRERLKFANRGYIASGIERAANGLTPQ